jgi:hypothetical protein
MIYKNGITSVIFTDYQLRDIIVDTWTILFAEEETYTKTNILWYYVVYR